MQVAFGQQIGYPHDIRPKLTTQTCTTKHGCISHDTSIVLDASWRNLEDIRTGESCITSSGELNKTFCSTAKECAKQCALSGNDYSKTGVEADGDSVTLHMYRHPQGKTETVSPQIYLLDPNGKDYSMLKLKNQEISFSVDVSALSCGMNGAIYLAAMDASGGRSELNPAGATYGTGYCDSQCYQYTFVNGVANIDNKLGACCNEMDLWEANARSTQLTPHPCNLTGFYACLGAECGSGKEGVCDKQGCGFNPYGLGAHHFYGYQGKVNTTKPFTVVTQFHTDDDTVHGSLTEIRRLYIQDGRVIHNAAVNLHGNIFNSITPAYCKATHANTFQRHGGLTNTGEALERGMALVMVSTAIYNPSLRHNDEYDRILRQVLIILCAGAGYLG